MDEPFGAVDPIVRKRLQDEFRDLQDRLGKTVVFVTHDVDEAIFLGDRMAILNIGGILEQYDSPETILAEPANDFVESFLGGERGLKRLGLLPVTGAAAERGPFVEVSVSPAEGRGVMEDHDVDWLGLLDGGRLLGWVDGSLVDRIPLSELEPRPFLVTLNSDSTLRSALDAVVTGHARVAVVVDDGMYRGMLDLEAIAEEITE
jgi:osmoprotectant transport system ATP-binding protein